MGDYGTCSEPDYIFIIHENEVYLVLFMCFADSHTLHVSY